MKKTEKNTLALLFGSAVALGFADFLHRMYSETLFDKYPFTFLFIHLTMSLCALYAFLYFFEKKTNAKTKMVSLLIYVGAMIGFAFLDQKYDYELSLLEIWINPFFSLAMAFIFYMVFKEDSDEQETKTKTSDDEDNFWNHIDPSLTKWSERLKEIRFEFQCISQDDNLISIEEIHDIEILIEDLERANEFYQNIHLERRQLADENMETLLLLAEKKIEELKLKGDQTYLVAIEKLKMKRKGEF